MPLFREQKSVQGAPGPDRYKQLIKKIQERAQQKKSTSVPKVEKKGASILEGRPYVPVRKVIEKMEKASPFIPGAGGAMYTKKERVEMAKEWLKGRGYYFEEHEIPQIYKRLNAERAKTKTSAERLKKDREIREFEREILGKK